MMRNPAHSRFGSSSAPSPHKNELRPKKHFSNRREGTHVEVTANEVDIVLQHFGMKELEKFSGCITFFWPQHCECVLSKKKQSVIQKEKGVAGDPRTMSETIPHVLLLVESTLYVSTPGSGSKVSLLSKTARSVLPVYAMN